MNITLAPSADLRCLSDINSDATEDCHFISLDYMGYNVSWDIINPYDDCEEGRVCEAVPYCPIEVSEFNSQRYIETGNKQLEDYINTTILPKNSSVWYKSLFDGCDINVEIKPNSIKENIVLNSREAANQKFTYYIETNNLVADLYDDNSIAFLDKEDKVIFYIPAPFMFEAEHNNIQSYDIDVTIEKYRNGYLMSYTPSEEWVMSEERNFPIIIDPDINISDNIYTSTLSESAPTSYITGNKLKIGGVPNDHFKALISIPLPSTTFSNDLISITDAKLYMYFNDYSGLSYQNGLRISALLSSYMPWWSGVSSNSLSQLERFELTGSGLKGFDVTPLVNGWYNYLRSNSKVGVYPYGVVIDSHYNYCCVYEADSSSGTNPPYYMISYKLNSNYTLTYTPDKYNDCNDIHNFTDRMNCYAYALQIYHQTYSQNFTVHKLMPGEIGLSLNPSCSTSTELQNYYNSITDDTDFINFVEQQMMFDSAIMGTNLQRITLSNEEQFILPTGYNESTQRIIAMNTGYNYPSNTKDFHFYVRHGNGSCEQHGGTCSTWSHKRGNYFISDTIQEVVGGHLQNTTICDNNIAQLAYNADYPNGLYSGTYYDTPVRFYTIQQDANVYNSWYEYNANRDRVSYVY